MKAEFRLTTSEYIEIDETQFSRLVDIIKQIGIEKFKSDHFLTEDDAEDLAEEYLQDEFEELVTNFIHNIDEEYIDTYIIDDIKYTYKDELKD